MGSKKTTIKETALGEAQMDTLTANQAGISGQVTDLSTDMGEGLSTVTQNQATITGNQQTLSDNQDTMMTNQGTMIGNQAALQQGQKDAASSRAEILSAVQSAPQVDLGPLSSQVSGVQSSVDTGFNTMGGRFDTVDSNLAGLQSSTDTGFTNMGQRFDTVDANLETGFDNLNTGITTGFDTAEANRAAMQEAILGGQVNLTDLLNEQTQTAATYYDDLSSGQADLRQGQGELQTGLTNFQDEYRDVSTRQSELLGDVYRGQEGGFNALREGQVGLSSGQADAAAAQRAAQAPLNQFQAQVSGELEALNAYNANAEQVDYARIAKEVSLGVSETYQGGMENQAEWNNQLAAMRQILDTQGDQMSENMRRDFTQLANAFDSTGKLISDQVFDNGSRMARAIDEQGNLLLAAFDSTGSKIQQQSLNINQMITFMNQQMAFAVGANANMGQLTPSSANTAGGGIMSPYSRTI